MEHHVYFWLKSERSNAEDQAAFEAGLDTLCQSPNISRAKWGKPAATGERPVTDHSWSYAISFAFETMEAHDLYSSDADSHHEAFLAAFKEWWEKVLVMDLE